MLLSKDFIYTTTMWVFGKRHALLEELCKSTTMFRFIMIYCNHHCIWTLGCMCMLEHEWTCRSQSPFCKEIWTHSIGVCYTPIFLFSFSEVWTWALRNITNYNMMDVVLLGHNVNDHTKTHIWNEHSIDPWVRRSPRRFCNLLWVLLHLDTLFPKILKLSGHQYYSACKNATEKW